MATKSRQAKGREFEELVFWINSCLMGQGTIAQNVQIPDKDTKQLRQVDILITLKSGPYSPQIMIEVRNHKKKIDVKYIEEVASKKNSIGAAQAAIVSKSGFTKPALLKANAHCIKTFTYSEAIRLNWFTWLEDSLLYFDNHIFQILDINFVMSQAEKNSGTPETRAKAEDCIITLNSMVVTPEELLGFYFHSKPELISNLPENGQFENARCTIQFDVDLKMCLKEKKTKIKYIQIDYQHRREVGIRPFSYSILQSEGCTVGEVISADFPIHNSRMTVDLLASQEGNKRKITSRTRIVNGDGTHTYETSLELRPIKKNNNDTRYKPQIYH